MSSIEDAYQRWLGSPALNEEERAALRAMGEEDKADAFYTEVALGTAGMRGILGPGTNRINRFTVRRATVAFGLYLLETFIDAKEKGVVISHDNRFHSRDFALEAADILNEMGIPAYIFDDLRPTPELSYAVRKVGAVGGIMITASHNPKEYNGYKVYDETGCQLVPAKIAHYIPFIKRFPDLLNVEIPEVASHKAETHLLPSSIDDDYVKDVEAIQIHPELDKTGFRIVYSPQHGTSYENAMRVFRDLGYDIHPVLSQCVHDPAFGATLSPNPETAESFIESLKLAKEINAQLCVMTDPDGDRCGLAYLSSKGTYERFTGNQSAALLLDYLLSERQRMGLLSPNGVMYDTIVTSDLGRKIAHSFGLSTESFLTGFKYIGDRIGYYERNGGPTFEFGYEESYGCLIAPFVRDKDGIQAILLYSEMALYYFRQGIPLDIAYENLEKKYGYHETITDSIYFEGPSGAKRMMSIMESLHNDPPLMVSSLKAVTVEDYKKRIKTDLVTGVSTALQLDESEVVRIIFEDSSWIAVRPSGTEPKCKFYIELYQKTGDDIHVKALKAIKEFEGLLGL